MVKDYIARLQQAIRDLHGCESQYLETVPVKEMFQGKIVWEGDVEVFQIRGHLKAKRVFAWSHVAGANDQQTMTARRGFGGWPHLSSARSLSQFHSNPDT